MHHPILPDLADSVPYVPVVVDLPGTGGCRLVGALRDVDVEDVRVGMEVELVWRDVRDGETVPTFRPATACQLRSATCPSSPAPRSS